MQPVKIVSVDFQKDFSAKDGLCYCARSCIDFIKDVLIPHFRKHNLKVAEIVSDYRLPRPGDEFSFHINCSQLRCFFHSILLWLPAMYAPDRVIRRQTKHRLAYILQWRRHK